MKNLYGMIFLILLFGGCGGSQAIYGVPEIEWQRMTQAEQQAAKDHFKQQTEQYAKTRAQAQKAKDEAEEFANQCHEGSDISESSPCQVKSRCQFGF